MVVLAGLLGLTSWVIASVSTWLVPVYVTAMALIFVIPRAEHPRGSGPLGDKGEPDLDKDQGSEASGLSSPIRPRGMRLSRRPILLPRLRLRRPMGLALGAKPKRAAESALVNHRPGRGPSRLLLPQPGSGLAPASLSGLILISRARMFCRHLNPAKWPSPAQAQTSHLLPKRLDRPRTPNLNRVRPRRISCLSQKWRVRSQILSMSRRRAKPKSTRLISVISSIRNPSPKSTVSHPLPLARTCLRTLRRKTASRASPACWFVRNQRETWSRSRPKPRPRLRPIPNPRGPASPGALGSGSG